MDDEIDIWVACKAGSPSREKYPIWLRAGTTRPPEDGGDLELVREVDPIGNPRRKYPYAIWRNTTTWRVCEHTTGGCEWTEMGLDPAKTE
jgi:hypothetical protein